MSQLFAGNSSGTATNPLSFFQSVPSATVNVSTRLAVDTSDIDWLIGGFIVTGNAPKKVIVRAIGPELTSFGVPNTLANPTLELHNGTGARIASNDNWLHTVIGGNITSDQVNDIRNSGLAPVVGASRGSRSQFGGQILKVRNPRIRGIRTLMILAFSKNKS